MPYSGKNGILALASLSKTFNLLAQTCVLHQPKSFIVPNNLLGIEHLSLAEITHLISRSDEYFTELTSVKPLKNRTTLAGKTVANLFFENSTRTRTSFELAEIRMGATHVSLSMQTSSAAKGESLLDTVKVITAMKVDAIVVRHNSSGVPQFLRKHLAEHISIINAGDGAHEHPTQALLDAATLLEAIGDLKGKRIAIIGDVLHSRVARSNILVLKKLGAEITLVAPDTLMPKYAEKVFAVETRRDIGNILSHVDAVIMLRIQLERQTRAFFPTIEEFRLRYGLTAERIKNRSMCIMHPGPINRGVELDDESADAERSLILRQVTHGIAMRMAVLEWIFT